MSQRKKAFTLIELIIVVVIIGILALIALPKYYANVDKAQQAQVYTNLDNIRQAVLAYYAAYGVYPASYAFPITVVIDGDTIMSTPDPSSSQWKYTLFGNDCLTAIGTRTGGYGGSYAYKQPGGTCWIGMCSNGATAKTCP